MFFLNNWVIGGTIYSGWEAWGDKRVCGKQDIQMEVAEEVGELREKSCWDV